MAKQRKHRKHSYKLPAKRKECRGGGEFSRELKRGIGRASVNRYNNLDNEKLWD